MSTSANVTNNGGNAGGNTDGSSSTSRGGGRNSKNKQKWTKKQGKQVRFHREIREMNGQVFQLQVEQMKNGPFQDTLEQLQVYSSYTYKKDIKYLKILFIKLKQPKIAKPERSDSSDDTLYNEEIHQYIKDKRSLETTTAALYNVV